MSISLPEELPSDIQFYAYFYKVHYPVLFHTALLELLVLRVCQRSSPHQGSVMVAKDVLLHPEHSFNVMLEQWSSQLACFSYKLQSLQLDMAEFACVNAIMLFEQGKEVSHVVGGISSALRESGVTRKMNAIFKKRLCI